ncbi:MAG: TolC family protein [Verrucomicrobia bacterium]|nr:TolC family protein [Verrucomicrobiota bacterium]MCH8510213.1 TolC family protein [Kiritimatiellia bacterium]
MNHFLHHFSFSPFQRVPRCSLFIILGSLGLLGCQSASSHREAADRSAAEIIEETQKAGLGRTEPFFVERPSETFRQRLLLDQGLSQTGSASMGGNALTPPEHWPDTGEPLNRPTAFFPAQDEETEGPVRISLVDALQIGAGNARDYQSRKEALFSSALQLDLERFRFDNSYRGALESAFSSNRESSETGVRGTGELGVQRTLETGATLSGRLVLDLVRLLSGDGGSSLGIVADGSITVPLLRGAGRHVVTESRTQAERDVLYSLYRFERFKRSYVVRVAREYFSVLQRRDEIANNEASYGRLELLVERTEALHERGRVTGIQVDQGRQDLLRARERLISSRENYQRELDNFKLTLGLPTDSRIELEEAEFDRLMEDAEAMLGGPATTAPGTEQEAAQGPRGRFEIDEKRAIELALENRLDLRVAFDEVEDAQRRVAIAADALRPGLDVTGSGRIGERRSSVSSASQGDARFNPGDGLYGLDAELDAPWSRRSERIAFRRSLLQLESAVRDAQELEDNVKLDVRNALRDLLQQREQYRIQAQALNIAERRVRQAQAFEAVGRAETRDVLEANEALLQAQNAVVDALVRYRISELTFQRDLGLLQVDERGLWSEMNPDNFDNEPPE